MIDLDSPRERRPIVKRGPSTSSSSSSSTLLRRRRPRRHQQPLVRSALDLRHGRQRRRRRRNHRCCRLLTRRPNTAVHGCKRPTLDVCPGNAKKISKEFTDTLHIQRKGKADLRPQSSHSNTGFHPNRLAHKSHLDTKPLEKKKSNGDQTCSGGGAAAAALGGCCACA